MRTDTEILKALADRLGCGALFPDEPREIFDELRRASAGGVADYAGITYERIAARTACSGHARRPITPARRGCSSIASPRQTGARGSTRSSTAPPAEEPDEDYPLS